MSLLFVLAFWAACAIAAAVVASHKNRNGGGWFFLTFLLSPLCLLIVAVLPRRIGADEVKCPECFGVVSRAARRCRHCGYIPPTAAVPPAAADRLSAAAMAADAERENRRKAVAAFKARA